jgi:hypothetical protein
MSHTAIRPAAPTCTEFMASFVGETVCLVRDLQPKVIGRLVHVHETPDEHDPVLVIAPDPESGERVRVGFSTLTRAKLHHPTKERDRRP